MERDIGLGIAKMIVVSTLRTKIETREELEEFASSIFEEGEYFIVIEGWRPWIVCESEHGDAVASSWRDEEGIPSKSLESLQLPLTIVHPREETSVTPELVEKIAKRVYELDPVRKNGLSVKWEDANIFGRQSACREVAKTVIEVVSEEVKEIA